jgi:tetratricopeptide (TPR) repeat protein
MKRFYITLLLPLFSIGCSTVESSLNYTEGTKALQAEQYDSAIVHLEKAVALEPKIARNHNNLASAYYAKGRIRDGWPHVRKAVMLAPRDQFAQGNFSRYFKTMIDKGLVKEGLSEATITKNLGAPDSTLNRDQETFWQYGMVALTFKGGRVAGFKHMEYR